MAHIADRADSPTLDPRCCLHIASEPATPPTRPDRPCRDRRLARAALLCATFAAVVVPAARAAALDAAAERYRPFMIEEIDQALAGARTLRERVAANDLAGAKTAWIAARVGWERAEVFTSGFVAELDEKIDAWPNALTGFHAIEAKLFGGNVTDVKAETDTLIFYLADLDVKIHYTPLNAQGLLNGAARLAYEVGEGKADGGESRYSGTSLDDMRNNAAGIQLAYETIFAAALEAADATLAETTRGAIARLVKQLDVADLNGVDPGMLRARSEELVVALQTVAPKIGLRQPTLEDLAQ
jgi:iron uptake system component EfeO